MATEPENRCPKCGQQIYRNVDHVCDEYTIHRDRAFAPPAIVSTDWLDALRENVAREEADLQRAYNEVLTKRMLGTFPNEITGFERALETALMPMARIRIAIERTLKSASNDGEERRDA